MTKNRARALFDLGVAGTSVVVAGVFATKAVGDLTKRSRQKARIPGTKRVPNLRVKK